MLTLLLKEKGVIVNTYELTGSIKASNFLANWAAHNIFEEDPAPGCYMVKTVKISITENRLSSGKYRDSW